MIIDPNLIIVTVVANLAGVITAVGGIIHLRRNQRVNGRKLDAVAGQLHPNGGTGLSLCDKVDKLAEHLTLQDQKMDEASLRIGKMETSLADVRDEQRRLKTIVDGVAMDQPRKRK
jgi:uncharacterized membrane protein